MDTRTKLKSVAGTGTGNGEASFSFRVLGSPDEVHETAFLEWCVCSLTASFSRLRERVV